MAFLELPNWSNEFEFLFAFESVKYTFGEMYGGEVNVDLKLKRGHTLPSMYYFNWNGECTLVLMYYFNRDYLYTQSATIEW